MTNFMCILPQKKKKIHRGKPVEQYCHKKTGCKEEFPAYLVVVRTNNHELVGSQLGYREESSEPSCLNSQQTQLQLRLLFLSCTGYIRWRCLFPASFIIQLPSHPPKRINYDFFPAPLCPFVSLNRWSPHPIIAILFFGAGPFLPNLVLCLQMQKQRT